MLHCSSLACLALILPDGFVAFVKYVFSGGLNDCSIRLFFETRPAKIPAGFLLYCFKITIIYIMKRGKEKKDENEN